MATIASPPGSTRTVTLHLDGDWLLDPLDPDPVRVRVRDYDTVRQPAAQGVFDPLGSRFAVVVDEVRQAPRGQLTLRLPDETTRTAVAGLLDPPRTLLHQIPADTPGGPGEQRYIRPVYPAEVARLLRNVRSPQRLLTIGWVEVEAP